MDVFIGIANSKTFIVKKYHLANTWIANIIKKGPEVPDKSNPYFVDEDASVFLRYVLKYVKLTIKAEKYILAAEIIKYEITKIPDRDPILVGLGKARDAVGRKQSLPSFVSYPSICLEPPKSTENVLK